MVENAAFESNPLGPLCFGPSTEESVLARGKDLEGWSQDPSIKLVKAVIRSPRSNANGSSKEEKEEEIVGWAGWKYYLDDPETREEKKRVAPPTSPSPQAFYDFFVRPNLFMKGKRYIALSVLAVHPKHQRKGVGSLLLKAGLEDIDKEHPSLPVWLRATEMGCPLYLRFGFKVAEKETVDLSKYGLEGVVSTNYTMIRG